MKKCRSLNSFHKLESISSSRTNIILPDSSVLVKLKTIQAREEISQKIKKKFNYELPKSVVEELKKKKTKSISTKVNDNSKEQLNFLQLLVDSVNNPKNRDIAETHKYIDTSDLKQELPKKKLIINLSKFKERLKQEKLLENNIINEQSIKNTHDERKGLNTESYNECKFWPNSTSNKNKTILPQINSNRLLSSRFSPKEVVKQVSQRLCEISHNNNIEFYKSQLTSIFIDYSTDIVSKKLLDRMHLVTQSHKNYAQIFLNHFSYINVKNLKKFRHNWDLMLEKLSPILPESVLNQLVLLK